MSEAALLVTVAGIASGCLLVIAVVLVWTTCEVRATLQRLNRLLPEADRALHEAHRSLSEASQLLARGNAAAHHVETTLRRACDGVSAALQRMLAFGNGARVEPRPSSPAARRRRERHHRS
jgi:hypothetical protein